MKQRLAEAVLDAIKIREESYDHNAAKEEKGMVDFSKFYKIPLHKAASMAVENAGFDRTMTTPLYLLIKQCWNDIQDWARDITNREIENGRKARK